ncbi:hypothetical protein KMP13_10135 [Epibacterium ulvae]|uniref:hypothetical protein n=1 Tax=Epibacterium ulvae TaxID=1156985 RepID=UPI001BFC4642|nr:hypothetical protein [Epibacterium ulvae]MBT8154249.1 hypothetical protein [Epibacterium ulvae]
MRTYTAVFAAACFALAGGLHAQEATPSHVFQVTEHIVQELKALNAENFSTARTITAPEDPTKPRHVLFLVRDQWRKVQLLRFINGLKSHSLPPENIHAITPAEVKAQVEKLLVEVQELRSAYGLGASEITAELPSGKTPTDVYGNLLQISAELDALGVPSTVPNDVYRLAASVVENLEGLAQRENIALTRAELPKSKGRTPTDAYAAALDLIAAIQNLASTKEAFAIQGGITVPTAAAGSKSPSDVIVVLSRAQADVMALLNAAKSQGQLTTAEYEGGKTPSDVYDAVMYARLLVEALTS